VGTVAQAWALNNSKGKGLETRSWRFDFSGGLSATGVWLKAMSAPDAAPGTILLSDQGKKTLATDASDRVNRGEQVLALDLLFFGDGAPQNPGPHAYAQMIASAGERPLGLEAAQLIALARWLGVRKVRVLTAGPRSQVIARVAAALEPALFEEITHREGIDSLRHLLDAPVEYQAAPELFCLGLLKAFDLR